MRCRTAKTESGDAIRAAIAAALAAAGTSDAPVEVVLKAGTYRVRHKGRQGYCFPIHQAVNLVVRGAGQNTKILITDPKPVVSSSGSVAKSPCVTWLWIMIRCLSARGRSGPWMSRKGVSIWRSRTVIPRRTRRILRRPPRLTVNGACSWTRPRAGIKAGTPDHYMTPRWEHREGRGWRFFTADEYHRRNLQHMRVGDAYVHLARGYGSAVTAQGCDGVRIENVTVHASPGLAVGLIGNRGEIAVHGLEVRFAADSKRLLTTDADGVHCQQNRSGPVIENCYFEGMADDAINIYAPPNVPREIRSPTQWLVSPGCLVLPGDRLQVLDPQTGRLRGAVQAVDVEVERRALLLTLDKPLEGAVAGADHRSADTLYNLDACGAGFQIRRNHMHGNRRYGCLLCGAAVWSRTMSSRTRPERASS